MKLILHDIGSVLQTTEALLNNGYAVEIHPEDGGGSVVSVQHFEVNYTRLTTRRNGDESPLATADRG